MTLRAFGAILLLFLSVSSCSKEGDSTPELRDGNDITAFTVTSDGVNLQVTISGTTISVVAPHTVASAEGLSLGAAISPGASIAPNPTSISSLTNPVTFTVTAENGDRQTYTVSFRRTLSPENDVLGVLLTYEAEELEANVDLSANQITRELPNNWRLNAVSATFTISELATISPDPTTITDYSNPVTYTVTAEDGTARDYEMTLTRLLSDANSLESFVLQLGSYDVPADIDQETGAITQKLPPSLEPSQIEVAYTVSEFATIDPDPATITDYSQPVEFTVTSESGLEKVYTVTISAMDTEVFINCDNANASKWFGGDSRGELVMPGYFFAPRNVGTGQTITPETDLYVSSFGVRFSSYFSYTDDLGQQQLYFGEATIRLHVRDSEGTILATSETSFSNPMTLFWQTFDLSDQQVVLKKDTVYYFTWYLVNGEELGITSGSSGNLDPQAGMCEGMGMSSTSTIREETELSDWNLWGLHSWRFNFRLNGLN